jgi:hypothetical protein
MTTALSIADERPHRFKRRSTQLLQSPSRVGVGAAEQNRFGFGR